MHSIHIISLLFCSWKMVPFTVFNSNTYWLQSPPLTSCTWISVVSYVLNVFPWWSYQVEGWITRGVRIANEKAFGTDLFNSSSLTSHLEKNMIILFLVSLVSLLVSQNNQLVDGCTLESHLWLLSQT